MKIDDASRLLVSKKFDLSPRQNPLTDRHQIWQTRLCRGYLHEASDGFLHVLHVHVKLPKFLDSSQLFTVHSQGQLTDFHA